MLIPIAGITRHARFGLVVASVAAAALLVILPLSITPSKAPFNAEGVEFTRIGIGFCTSGLSTNGTGDWPNSDHDAYCIDRDACEAKCTADLLCRGFTFAVHDRMGHCVSGPNEWGVTLAASFHNPGESSMSRCVLYFSADLSVVVAGVTNMPDPGDPQWIVESTFGYTCYAARRLW